MSPMLSQTSRMEVLKRINSKVGFSVREDLLSPSTRQAITNLAAVQRHLLVVTTLLRGEQSRVEKSLVLRAASRLGRDSERKERAELGEEMAKLQDEVDRKVDELAAQVLQEEKARRAGLPPPEREGKLEAVELKCPTCGAALPMPTGRLVKCRYCGTALSIQEVGSQMSSIIGNI